MEDTSKKNKDVLKEDLEMTWVRWKCLVCNYVYEGGQIVLKCPKCGNEDPDKFCDVD
jgi:rubrerythrin